MLNQVIKRSVIRGSVSLSTTPVLVPATSGTPAQRAPYAHLEIFANTKIIYAKETMDKVTAPTLTTSDYDYIIPVFAGTPYIITEQNDDVAIWMIVGSGTDTVKWKAK